MLVSVVVPVVVMAVDHLLHVHQSEQTQVHQIFQCLLGCEHCVLRGIHGQDPTVECEDCHRQVMPIHESQNRHRNFDLP